MLDGEQVAEAQMNDQDEFQTTFTPTHNGEHTLRVEASGTSASAEKHLTIHSPVDVGNVNSVVREDPNTHVRVCADVESDGTPEVRLIKDGETLMTKSETGNVCFERQFQDGNHRLQVEAVSGTSSDHGWTTVYVDNPDTQSAVQEPDSRLANLLQPLFQAIAALVAFLANLAA
jgi:hypothetical protein